MGDAPFNAATARVGRDESFLRSLVVWGRVTGASLVLVMVVLAALMIVDSSVYAPAVDRSIQGTGAVRQTHEAMLDQQIGLRGFLLSGDARFLGAYRRGQQALPKLNAEATRRLARETRLGELLLEMRLAQQRWLDGWAADALALGQTPGAVTGAFLDQDKALFDDYRQHYDALITELVDHRDQGVDDQRRALAVAIGVALAVTVASGALGVRRSRRLRRAI